MIKMQRLLILVILGVCVPACGGSNDGTNGQPKSEGARSTLNTSESTSDSEQATSTPSDQLSTSGTTVTGVIITTSPEGYRASITYSVALDNPVLNIKDAPPGHVLLSVDPRGEMEVSNEAEGGRTLHFDWSEAGTVGVGFVPSQYGAKPGSIDACELMRNLYCFLGSLGGPDGSGTSDIEAGYVATVELGAIRVVSDDPLANSHKFSESEGSAMYDLIKDGVPPVIEVDAPTGWTIDSCKSTTGIIGLTKEEYGMPEVACTDGIPGR